MDSSLTDFFGSMRKSFGNDLGPIITQFISISLTLLMGYFVYWSISTYLAYLKSQKTDYNVRRCLEDRCGLSGRERKWMDDLVKGRGIKPSYRLLLYKTVMKRHMDERDLDRRGIDPELLLRKVFRDS